MSRIRLGSLVALLWAVPMVSSGGDDWPRFLGPYGGGKSLETGLPTEWPDGLPQVWDVEAGEGYSTPVVEDGVIYFFDRNGESARLRALDSTTGKELWRSEYPSAYEDYYDYSKGPRASPVADGERVYTFGVEGMLRCHRAKNGELLWQVDTTTEYGVVKNFFGVGSTPVIEGDLLIVPIGGSPPGSPKIHSNEVEGNGTGVVAFDKLTGEVRYRASDELASYATPVLATIGDRRWGFHFARGGLLGFAPQTGEIDFHFPWRAKILESVNAASPVVVGDRVFISETYGPGSALLRVEPGNYEVVRLDPPRGDQSLALHWSTPIHHEGILYASSGRNSGDAELRAVELDTGKVRWSGKGLTRSTLLFVDGHLIVLTEYGRLLVVKASPDAYEVVAELTPTVEDGSNAIRFPAWGPPILAHGLLYVRGADRLFCFRLLERDLG